MCDVAVFKVFKVVKAFKVFEAFDQSIQDQKIERLVERSKDFTGQCLIFTR